MPGTQHLLPDRQGALHERFGLRVVALGTVEQCQVVEALCCVGMQGAQHLLTDRQGPRKVGDRILIAQDLDPPLPNCTCGLSPHTALTESPTFFRWIWVVCQI